jgi:mannose-6-phosphate isomerase-like protein (cupin superfamily)
VGDFPKFMKSAANRIATSSQSTPGVEGYVYDGTDGTQMAFWTCHQTAVSARHVHDFDEYMLVVQGCYRLVFGENRVPVKAGEEYFIPKGLWHAARWWPGRERFTLSEGDERRESSRKQSSLPMFKTVSYLGVTPQYRFKKWNTSSPQTEPPR